MIGHCESRRLLRQIERADDAPIDPCAAQALRASSTPATTGPRLRSSGWSRPVAADHTELAALEDAQRQAARARRRRGAMPAPLSAGCFIDCMERLKDGPELHLVSFCTSSLLADEELHLTGTDNPAFDDLKSRYADVLGWVPLGLPPDRCMELELETGDAPMPVKRLSFHRPVKRLSEGELAELRTQLIDLLDRGWMMSLDPALDGRTRGARGFCQRAGRDVVDLLRLPGTQRHHATGS